MEHRFEYLNPIGYFLLNRDSKEKAKFRLQGLKMKQVAIEIANELCLLADAPKNDRLFRFAEQGRNVSMFGK